MQTLVQQTLNENPYYEHLNFDGKDIRYTPEVMRALVKNEINFANTHDGNLAIPGQPGGVWADYTRWRWLLATENGTEDNFRNVHGPKLTTLLEQDYVKHIQPPVTPVNPVVPVVPVTPVVPVNPVVPVVPVVPVCPIIPPSAVPEPATWGLGLISIAMVFVSMRLRNLLFN